MSRIDDLIRDLCPDGVPHVKLDDLVAYEQPTKYLVKSIQYDDTYPIPVLTAGQTFMLGRTDETEGIYPASSNSPVIIFDDFTTAFQWVDFPFKAKSSAMKMLTVRDDLSDSLRFIWHAMQGIFYAPQDHKRRWISTYSNFRIPRPPLEVQDEIVRILDNFSARTAELEGELEGELEARHAQYEYYRDALLTSSGAEDDSFQALEDLVSFINGKPHEKLVDPSGDMPLMTSKFISTQGQKARYIKSEDALTPAEAGDVAIVMSDLPNGRALARGFYVEASGKYAANQRVCLLRSADKYKLDSRYLYYAIDRNRQLLRYDNGFDQTHLKKSQILNVKLWVPPLEQQKAIAASLDRFDTLVNDLNSGLPAEIEARRKQYEYYRDRLLTFEEPAA